jgi:hypothetical protein
VSNKSGASERVIFLLTGSALLGICEAFAAYQLAGAGSFTTPVVLPTGRCFPLSIPAQEEGDGGWQSFVG